VFSSADAKFVVLAFSSLFSVINPIEAAPIFVAMTRGMEDRRRVLAIRASMAAALILAVFALTGGAIFAFFGITLPAFRSREEFCSRASGSRRCARTTTPTSARRRPASPAAATRRSSRSECR
jgi:hypothetical protein